MMKQLSSVGFISLSLAFSHFSYSIKNTRAQTEIKPNVEINNSNLDDNQAIAIEVKDVDNWQKMLNSQSWSCDEKSTKEPSDVTY